MLSIGVVARQTGIETATLRKWETRYGFLQPLRHASGQRYYREADVDLLHAIARRLASGERIGQISRELRARPAALAEVPSPATPGGAGDPLLGEALSSLLRCDLPQLQKIFDRARQDRSLRSFVEDFAAPLTQRVGEAWARGDLPVHGEHLFSYLLESVLVREANGFAAAAQPPQILLATLAGERHTLGISMVSAVLAEAGFACLPLSVDLPVAEIAAAASSHRVDVVGISASSHYPPRLLRAQIAQLRAALPDDIALWLGGAGFDKLSAIPAGSTAIVSLQQLLDSCRELPGGASRRTRAKGAR